MFRKLCIWDDTVYAIRIVYGTCHIRWNSPSSGFSPKSPEASTGASPNHPLALCRNTLWPRNDNFATISWICSGLLLKGGNYTLAMFPALTFPKTLFHRIYGFKCKRTENDDGASNIWKARPFTSSWPWMLGKLSPFDIQICTCNKHTKWSSMV